MKNQMIKTQTETKYTEQLEELRLQGYTWNGGREIAGPESCENELELDMEGFYATGENTALFVDHEAKTVTYGEAADNSVASMI